MGPCDDWLLYRNKYILYIKKNYILQVPCDNDLASAISISLNSTMWPRSSWWFRPKSPGILHSCEPLIFFNIIYKRTIKVQHWKSKPEVYNWSSAKQVIPITIAEIWNFHSGVKRRRYRSIQSSGCWLNPWLNKRNLDLALC